jgi:DNA-binding transcriptional MocR family regulator
VSAGRFSQQVQRAKLMCTISASIPSQVILSDYLQHGGYERHLKQLRQQLQQQYQQMRAAIIRYFPADTELSVPQGGYFLWLTLNPAVNTLKLFEQALAKGISISPGPMFYAHDGHKNNLRLNYGLPFTARVEQAIEQLGELINAQLTLHEASTQS